VVCDLLLTLEQARLLATRSKENCMLVDSKNATPSAMANWKMPKPDNAETTMAAIALNDLSKLAD
jgi:hypothetical protein